MDNFDGFSAETISFLKTVQSKNSKKWFEDHRRDYNEYLLGPLRALVMTLSRSVIGIDSRIETSPTINRTISKIFRDTRFSKDKSLFRNEAWISFKRKRKDRMTIPEFYFYLTPESYEYGMGYYSADRASMDLFRNAITQAPASFRKTLMFENNKTMDFERFEDRYKRIISNKGPEDLQDWYQMKSFCCRIKKQNDKILFDRQLADDIGKAFSVLTPLYLFIINCTIAQ